MGKTQKAQKFITMSKAHCYMTPITKLVVAHTYYKICYYTTLITKPIATQHPLQSPLLHSIHYKAPLQHNILYMTPITKLVDTWHLLQNLLLHDAHYKAYCYTAPITKPIAIRHPLQSPIATRHPLQSPLLHNNLYKTYWYTTPYKVQKKHLAIFMKAQVRT